MDRAGVGTPEGGTPGGAAAPDAPAAGAGGSGVAGAPAASGGAPVAGGASALRPRTITYLTGEWTAPGAGQDMRGPPARQSTAAAIPAALGALPLLPLPPRGSRLAVPALVVAFALVLVGLGVADRAIAGTLAGSGRLRLAVWLLGGAALLLVAIGLAHERRLARRVAERSTELERLSAELIRVNRVKSEFLANVSHELRTPLNAIVGFVELLHDGVYGDLAPRQVGPVERIAGSAQHLRTLVDQILDLAKITAGRLEVHPERVALRPFVFGVASDLEPLVQEKGLALSLAVPATLPRVRTDPGHLRQILVNLLGNAVKFTPGGDPARPGRITVRAVLAPAGPPVGADGSAGGGHPGDPRRVLRVRDLPRLWTRFGLPGGRRLAARLAAAPAARAPAEGGPPWIALHVSDTGPGISPEAQGRIFDEFEQVGPRTGDAAQRGTGLGLAISRRLARLLEGELTVESVPGRGSTFTLWLRAEG